MFPHHREGILRLLGCEYNRESVAHALRAWDADVFERAAAEAGVVVAVARSFDQWDVHPQGRAVAALPLLTLTRLGDAVLAPLPSAGDRPLTGVRVLDLTRVV